ncbi:MAG: ester cyclase [Geminicoccaceae bacterium]
MVQTLRDWARRVWVERDESAIASMLSPDTTAHGLGMQTLVGPAEFKPFHTAVCALLRDTELVVDHHIEAEGWLAALCTFKGTSHDGREVAITGTIYGRFADGKILEAYNHFDFVGLFTQLGLLPPEVLVRCLAGKPGCPAGAQLLAD